MAFSDKPVHHEKPRFSYQLFIWLIQVIVVLLFCCAVIRLCLIARPPTYTLADLTVPATRGGNEFSLQKRDEITQNHTLTTMVFSLVITNPNKNKGILYDETAFTLTQKGLIIGKSSLKPFYQNGMGVISNSVLVNVDRFVLGQNGTLKVGLETTVRYRILRWTTKQHSLNLEASVAADKDGMFSINEEGVTLKPSK